MINLDDYNVGDKFVITIKDIDSDDVILKYQTDVKEAWVTQEFLDSCHKLPKSFINNDVVDNKDSDIANNDVNIETPNNNNNQDKGEKNV